MYNMHHLFSKIDDKIYIYSNLTYTIIRSCWSRLTLSSLQVFRSQKNFGIIPNVD